MKKKQLSDESALMTAYIVKSVININFGECVPLVIFVDNFWTIHSHFDRLFEELFL